MSLDYKQAGVDVEAGYKAVSLIKRHALGTHRKGVLSGIGGFGSMFSLADCGLKNPVLVSGTDGVGTKLKLAFLADKHDTVGIDCVAMCANDVVCSGAEPLFFLDYIATSKLVPEKIEAIVKGVSDGCLQAGCALVGGETAEMPGFYADGEYDIAGFCVGAVEQDEIIDGSTIAERDLIIGLASNGVHSNGFSLVRKLFGEEKLTELSGELLAPTRIYVKPVLGLKKEFHLKGICHITGGGFIENIPRIIPEGLGAVINGSWDVPPIFDMIRQVGEVEKESMFNTFNMGIGMVIMVNKTDADAVIERLNEYGERAYKIGEIIKDEGIVIC